MEVSYNHGKHCKYLLQYHIVWCPKFRYGILINEKRDYLIASLHGICKKYNFVVRALEVMPDHVHIFLSAPQTIAPSEIVRILKSCSAIDMLNQFPDLRMFYSKCKVLWSRGYYIASIGHISASTVQKYIEEQTHHGNKKNKICQN